MHSTTLTFAIATIIVFVSVTACTALNTFDSDHTDPRYQALSSFVGYPKYRVALNTRRSKYRSVHGSILHDSNFHSWGDIRSLPGVSCPLPDDSYTRCFRRVTTKTIKEEAQWIFSNKMALATIKGEPVAVYFEIWERERTGGRFKLRIGGRGLSGRRMDS